MLGRAMLEKAHTCIDVSVGELVKVEELAQMADANRDSIFTLV